MSLQQILEQIVDDRGPIVLLIVIAMTLVQVAPIKINPWGALFGWIGKQINREVLSKINVVEDRLDHHIQESSDSELRTRRANILDFSSSVLRGVNHQREKFEFMISECDNYEEYCHEHNIKNGVAEASIEEIRRVYQDRLRNRSFLSTEGSDSK